MTDDKKKRNKKKKNNKQPTNTNTNTNNVNVNSNSVGDRVGEGETSSVNNHEGGDVENVKNDAVLSSVEAEREQWVQKEAVLEGTIRELRNANDVHVQKEGSFEVTIKELRKENNSLLQKEASLNETVEGLRNDMASHLHKEATFGERIRELQTANDLYVQKEAGLEIKVAQFQSEKNMWLDKEASLETKIMYLEKEKESWVLKEASFVEKITHLEQEKETWILKEKCNCERIALLNDDVARLEAQVLELGESRKACIQDNQLKEKISAMQCHIENLERSISSAPSIDEFTKLASERDSLYAQIEAAQDLVERLIMENAELVEKINELYIEPHHQNGVVSVSHMPGADGTLEPSKSFIVPEALPKSSENAGEQMNSLEVLISDKRTNGDHLYPEHSEAVSNSSESRESGEIVQIPLDDIEVGASELQNSKQDEMSAVPLMDAPLTGAPFRLISYFTRYVSGADLVEKNSSDSRH